VGVLTYNNGGVAHFIMNGGEISNNTCGEWGGGGLRVEQGTFTYNAGIIANNTADNRGQQVCKNGNGSIDGTGGVSVGTGSDQYYDVWPSQP
jgi:hypothetical protein